MTYCIPTEDGQSKEASPSRVIKNGGINLDL